MLKDTGTHSVDFPGGKSILEGKNKSVFPAGEESFDTDLHTCAQGKNRLVLT